MTTRKALIERIQAMQLGTQEMLDAAVDDARLIPFDTLFFSKINGCAVWRMGDGMDDDRSVFMVGGLVLFHGAQALRPMSEE